MKDDNAPWWLVTHEATGLVDGYYRRNRDALRAALKWEKVMGSGCSVRAVEPNVYIPPAAHLSTCERYVAWQEQHPGRTV